MDKLTLGFIADLLYVKGYICFEEFEAIQNARIPSDLDEIVDKMLRSDFNVYRKGESASSRK